MFVDVRHPQTKKLLFRYDAERQLVEMVDRGVKTLIDLAEYGAPSPDEPLTVNIIGPPDFIERRAREVTEEVRQAQQRSTHRV